MDSTASLTVIMPCLNAEATVSQALESIFAQTAQPMEILVIDDGCTDRSLAIAQSFGPKVRIIRNRQRGPNAARRTGVVEARGKYIALTDADDFIAPTKHEKQLAVLRRGNPYTIVHTGAETFWDDGSSPPVQFAGGELATGKCTKVLFQRNWICGASVMFHRSIILELGNYDPEFITSGDYALWLVASTCCDFVYIPEPLYHRRRHEKNITNRTSLATYYHWLAQEKFRRRYSHVVARWPAEFIYKCMVEPVLRVVDEAYWRRDGRDYMRLLKLAASLNPEDQRIMQLWRRRWIPMSMLRMWDRITIGHRRPLPETM